MNNTEISETLCISVGTTKAHIHNIFAKVEVDNLKPRVHEFLHDRENLEKFMKNIQLLLKMNNNMFCIKIIPFTFFVEWYYFYYL